MTSSDLDLLLAAAGTVRADEETGTTWSLEAAPLGRIHLATGSVVVGDPFVGALSDPPLLRQLPPGPHPVSLCVVRIAENHLRVGALMVHQQGTEVVRWSRAHWKNGAPAELGVDAGTLAIACADRAASLDTEEHSAALLDAFADNQTLACRHPAAPQHVIAATAGWGDGIYAAWWGLDAQGSPVALVLDTEVLTAPIWDTTTLPLPLPLLWRSASVPLLREAGVELRRALLRPGTVFGHRLRRHPRLRVGPPGGPWRTVPRRTTDGRTAWSLGLLKPGDQLEIGLIRGHRPLRRLSPLPT